MQSGLSRSPDRPAPGKYRFLWRSPTHAAVSIGIVVVLAGALLAFVPDFVANRFLKGRVIAAFGEAYPAYALRIGGMHYSIWTNQVRCDSVLLAATDSTVTCTVAGFSVSGMGRMQFLRPGIPGPDDFRNAVVTVQGIVFRFPLKEYEIRCGLLHVSVPDSEASVEALTLNPPGDDELFFAGSRVRKTRIRLVVPRASARGVDCLALLRGDAYRALSARIDDPFFDVLVNKDKPRRDDSTSPPWPNELLAGIAAVLQVDSLNVMNGRVKYGERFAVGARAALITVDSLHMLVEGIANHGDPAALLVIRAEGKFMEAGTLALRMSIPIASGEPTFHYSGSLSGMDLCALDVFLETAEQVRIKSGVLQEAAFEINVASGCASGSVRAVYRDFTLAAINRQTGSEKGIPDAVASFIANTFTIHGTNVPDKSGSLRAGNVKYARKRDDSFLQFSWFALRSGVRDVVGL